ncbi:hypothetical protein [Oligosphaera ethanolica]|uniref:Uncharacterized protein n=1 Tax=Oligosphaera ethanolica TaxID=760260 RepID=A0AAE3VIN0_9BACT|nr:hypothetical protein [Oligosphaera ethanolica]MDQ0291427.1 hypothetical protein [Oligosphaera ethanolica]NLE56021.1 hypothetical protein [Lentisphaerota bacterium]
MSTTISGRVAANYDDRKDDTTITNEALNGRVAANYDDRKDVFSNLATAQLVQLSLAAKRQKR